MQCILKWISIGRRGLLKKYYVNIVLVVLFMLFNCVPEENVDTVRFDYSKEYSVEKDEMIPENYGGHLFEHNKKLYFLLENTNAPLRVNSTNSRPSTSYVNELWKSDDGITWKKITENPITPVRRASDVVSFKGDIILVGGQHFRTLSTGYQIVEYLNDVWKSEAGTEWMKLKDDSRFTPRIRHQLISFNKNIYLIGGGSLDYSKKVEVWVSQTGDEWKLLSEPFELQNMLVTHKIIQNNGAIYLFDAGLGIQRSTDGRVWTKIELNASTKESLGIFANLRGFTIRSNYGLVSLKNRLYLFGGGGLETFDGLLSGLYNDVWLSEDGEEWTLLSSRSDERHLHERYGSSTKDNFNTFPARENFYSIDFNNHIYMIGGTDREGNWIPETWVSPDGVNWKLLAKVEE
jgi:hypothetical protein